MTNPTTREHGDANTYIKQGCRCGPCTAANTERARHDRNTRMARRRLVDGVMVAPVPPHRHGNGNTYTNWGCRCKPCTRAHNHAHSGWVQRRAAATP
jgi:hypothetical protein